MLDSFIFHPTFQTKILEHFSLVVSDNLLVLKQAVYDDF